MKAVRAPCGFDTYVLALVVEAEDRMIMYMMNDLNSQTVCHPSIE